MQRGTSNTARPVGVVLAVTALAFGTLLVGTRCTRVIQPPRLTGTLPKPLHQMTRREFANFAAQLRWVAVAEARRRCDTTEAGGDACRGPTPAAETRARILLEETGEFVGLPNAPRNGAVVWKLVNLGGRTENRYKLRAGRNYSYYVVVLPRSEGGYDMPLRIVEVDASDTSAEAPVVIHMSGVYHGCDDHPVRYPYRVAFQNCPAGAGGRGLMILLPARRSAHTQLGLFDEPAWGRCPSGCCTGS